ncbi:hypothetical protein [Capsulimonas corticalis]|nr:hypothetical protein [Capsulimonas corticalis]
MTRSQRRYWTALGAAALLCAHGAAQAQSLDDRRHVAQAAQTASDAVALGRKVEDLRKTPNNLAVKTGEGTMGVVANTAGNVVGKGVGQLFGSRFGRFFGHGTRSLIKTGGRAAGAAVRGASDLGGSLSRKLSDTGTQTLARGAKSWALSAERQAQRDTQDQFLARALGAAAPMARQALAQAAQGSALDLGGQSGWSALLATAARNNPAMLQDLLAQQASGGASRTNMLALIANAVRGDASLANALINPSKDPSASAHTNDLVQAAFADNLPLIQSLLLTGGSDITSTLATQALAAVLQQMLPPGPAQDLASAVSGGIADTAVELAPVVKEGVQSLAGLVNGGE